ncbi:substrate-binding domain-containing protein [Ramlibacter aquaticus]|uniref:Substrate-binding domain-containing protein n=2 Tax=Comamonadaceae TaxID=80864 RepID=A0ABR9SGV8_9BURK|nr:substrate-binding domain-containing protein [Ramlibacter aquaticus]
MATRQVLAELAQAWQQAGGRPVAIESVGGVEAAKRVAEGEAFDVVFLASDAIDKLLAAGHALAGSKVDLVRSAVAAAVPAGAPRPGIATEAALRAAVLAAPSIGYSTGPSGTALLQLFERWGLAAELAPRLKQARPGVPVGSLVASGEVALGFQQLPELIHVADIQLLDPLPAAVQIETVFSGAACAGASDPGAVQALLAFMASPAAAEAKHRQGMQPA